MTDFLRVVDVPVWAEAPTPAPVEVSDFDVEWQRGWSLYELGAGDGVCANHYQTQGWWDACEADANAHPMLDLSGVRWDDDLDDLWEVGA